MNEQYHPIRTWIRNIIRFELFYRLFIILIVSCFVLGNILKAKGLEAVKDSCYNTAPNLEIAKGIYELCERKGYSITQALMGFFAVQDFDVLPLASADNPEQLQDLKNALATEYDPADYTFLK